MNDTTRLDVRPEVAEFLDRVRARLADLTDEEREELLGGLEGDITELLHDGGSVTELGDPRAYADELRAAAGFRAARARRIPSVPRPRRPRRPVGETASRLMDRARAHWEQRMAAHPALASTWEVVRQLRPAWWLLRAWIAVQLLDVMTGPWEHATLVPRFGNGVTGPVLLLGAASVSVLLGLRRLWPASASPGSPLARIVLLSLNVYALLMLVTVVDHFPSSSLLNEWSHPRASGLTSPYVPDDGLVNDGRVVRNVYAFDASGEPIQGVQLYDQNGKPLAVDPYLARRMRYQGRLPTIYSWYQGEARAWNVYPLPVRFDGGWRRPAKAWSSDNPPFQPQPPMVAVPPVTLPGTDDSSEEQAEKPTGEAPDGPAAQDGVPRAEEPKS